MIVKGYRGKWVWKVRLESISLGFGKLVEEFGFFIRGYWEVFGGLGVGEMDDMIYFLYWFWI